MALRVITPEALTKLTREEKIELLALHDERDRRARLRPENYKPNPGQLQVHECQATERYVFSGNGAGKTTLLTNEAQWAAEGFNPILLTHTRVPCRIVVVLDKPEKVSEVWLPELKKWGSFTDDQFHKDGKPYIRRITWGTGSQLVFMFWDQEDMAFESIEADFFIFDEPPPRKHYIALKRGGRTKGRKARYLFGGTPLAAPWLRTEVYEPWSRGERKGTECFRFGTEVNKDNLADGYVADFSSVLSEKERRIRLHGEFFDLEGLALAHLFKRSTHTIGAGILDEFRERQWPCIVAVDPHPEKKTHAILLGVDKHEKLFVLKELALKATPRDFADAMKEWAKGFRVYDWVCDNYGSGQYTGGYGFKSFIEVANERGVRIRPTRYDEKQDDAFIERIQDGLIVPPEGAPRLMVVESCRGSIADIENVEWVKYRDIDTHKPKLNITNRDYLSCIKYALAAHPRFDRSRSRIIKAGGPVSWSKR